MYDDDVDYDDGGEKEGRKDRTRLRRMRRVGGLACPSVALSCFLSSSSRRGLGRITSVSSYCESKLNWPIQLLML